MQSSGPELPKNLPRRFSHLLLKLTTEHEKCKMQKKINENHIEFQVRSVLARLRFLFPSSLPNTRLYTFACVCVYVQYISRTKRIRSFESA